MRRLLGTLYFRTNDLIGHYRLSQTTPPPVAILMYHGLGLDGCRIEAARGMEITPDSCLREINFFRRQGYELVSPEFLSQTAPIGSALGYLLVTFDDGHRNTFQLLQEWMRDYRFPILVAICPEVVRNGCTYWWEELRARFDLIQRPFQWRDLRGELQTFSRGEADRAEALCRSATSEQASRFLCSFISATTRRGPLIAMFHMALALETQQVLESSPERLSAQRNKKNDLETYPCTKQTMNFPESLWRFWIIPAAVEPGNETWSGGSWKTGAGPTWLTGSYDPEFDLLCWGADNPSPDWNEDVRLEDNLSPPS